MPLVKDVTAGDWVIDELNELLEYLFATKNLKTFQMNILLV